MDAKITDIYRKITGLCEQINFCSPEDFHQIENEIARLEEELLILERK